MTESVTAQTDATDSAEAGRSLGAAIAARFPDAPADVVIVFASARYDYGQLLRSLRAACGDPLTVGCSSAGEFTGPAAREGSACAIALRAPEMKFTGGIGRGLREDRAAAAQQLVASFRGPHDQRFRYRTALVLSDALAGHADELIEQLTVLTAGAYQFFGGGAGDDAKFTRTHVFLGDESATDAAVALEILSNKPLGIGVRHGWIPASEPMRVTAAEGTRLVSLNAAPAAEALEEHAARTGQRFDRANPLPFFLNNTLGVQGPDGYKLRVPLAVNPDGSITCAAEVPTGALVAVMRSSASSTAEAAHDAAEDAVRQLGGARPAAALVFDCVATRLRLGADFGKEIDAVERTLGTDHYAGCNTYGQIARAEGQFNGFHNCTAVVCAIPG